MRNTETAVKAMEQKALYTQNGMESIQKANESSSIITSSNEELMEQIHEIDKADFMKDIEAMKFSSLADFKKKFDFVLFFRLIPTHPRFLVCGRCGLSI